MQPFTNPELARLFHEEMIARELEQRHFARLRGAIAGVRFLVGDALLALASRIDPNTRATDPVAPVVDLASHLGHGQSRSRHAGNSGTDSRPAA